MKFLLLLPLLGFLPNNNSNTLLNKPDSATMVCGDDPSGNWFCVYTTYDDGSDCFVIDNEGAPGGIQYINCDQ